MMGWELWAYHIKEKSASTEEHLDQGVQEGEPHREIIRDDGA